MMSSMTSLISKSDNGDLKVPAHEDRHLIWAATLSGEKHALCFVPIGENDKYQLRAAEGFYRISEAGKTSLEFEISSLKGQADIRAWSDISMDATNRCISELKQVGISTSVLNALEANLNIDKSLEEFRQVLKKMKWQDSDKELAWLAHEEADKAHLHATFARPQDKEGLFHVPYSQHPRNMAILAMKIGLSPTAVAGIILHDVVEDTGYTESMLRKKFPADVVDFVVLLTKPENQSRQQFLEHVAELTSELKIGKHLDRFDNLIRGFGIKDPDYHQRILSECESTYDLAFKNDSKLQPFLKKYNELKKELAKYAEHLRDRPE
jgi:hypothetical protein